MDFGFGDFNLNPFSGWGSGFAGGAIPADTSGGVVTPVTSSSTPWYTSLIDAATGTLGTVLNYKIAQNQVNHNQLPSQNATVGNLGSVGNVNMGGLIVWVVLILVVVAVFRAAFGRR